MGEKDPEGQADRINPLHASQIDKLPPDEEELFDKDQPKVPHDEKHKIRFTPPPRRKNN